MLRLFAAAVGAAVAGTGRQRRRQDIENNRRDTSRMVRRRREDTGMPGAAAWRGGLRSPIALVCALLAILVSGSAIAPGLNASPQSDATRPAPIAADARAASERATDTRSTDARATGELATGELATDAISARETALGRIDVGAAPQTEAPLEGQSAVRAASSILVLPDHTPTLWRGAPAVRALNGDAPNWVVGLAARTQPKLPVTAALAQDAPIVAVAAAPLWSPHLSAEQQNVAAADPIALGVYEVGSIPASQLPEIPPRRVPPPVRRQFDRPTSAATPRPSISLVLTAFGVSKAASEQALSELPPEIAVAIAPVAPAPFDWVERARRTGRMTFIEAPMEPSSYPRINPGPMTLLTSLGPDENAARFASVLALAANVDGVATYLGDKFMRDADALRPIVDEISDRGYFVFENNDDRRSQMGAVAKQVGVPVRRPRVSLDKGGRVRDIGRALAELEAAARVDGHAIGVAVAKPSTVEALLAWSRDLDRRGFRLQHLPR